MMLGHRRKLYLCDLLLAVALEVIASRTELHVICSGLRATLI